MASSRPAIGVALIESFWRAIGVEIEHFCMISVISGPRVPEGVNGRNPCPLDLALGDHQNA